MAEEAMIQRVYDIKVLGADAGLKHVNALTVAFNKMDAAKKKLNTQLDKKMAAGDTAAITSLTARIKELETAMKNIDRQREKSAKETALQAKAEKDLAAAEATRTINLIQQEKELDRQIALEERRSRQREKEKRDLRELPGNYYALLAAQRQTLEAYRSTPENSPLFEKVKKDAISAKAAVDNFNRSLSPDGTLVGEYKSGIINAFSKLGLNDVLKKQRDDLNGQLGQLLKKNTEMANKLRVVGDTGKESFKKIEAELVRNIQRQEEVEANLRNINSAFQNTGGLGQQVVNGIGASFKNLKRDIGQMIVGYVGFQAAIQGTRQAITLNAELSDKYVDLQRVLGATDDEFAKIRDTIRGLNTRTSLTQLMDFAFIAAKAGVAKEQIADVTASLDQLYLVAGKSLGDPETTFESLVKLNTIFNDDAPVTGENLQKLGNAIIALDESGVASAGFMVDFAKRLAGIEGITKIQIQSVLGLAAAFEENGASAEVAATATSQVIVKLYSDTQKYALIAGMTKQAFEDLLNSNPGEALLRVSEGLKGNATAATEFAANFSQLEANGVRVQAVMGTLAANTDQFRQKIGIANTALQTNDAIIAGAEKKNQNFAASIDKLRKKFQELSTSRIVLGTLTALTAVFGVIISNIGVLIGLLTLYGIGWLTLSKEIVTANGVMKITNAQLMLQKIQLAANNVVLGVTRLYTLAATIAQSSYNAALTIFVGTAGRATAATTLLGNATRLLPFGIILTVLGLLVASLKAFGNAAAGSAGSLRMLEIRSQALQEVNRRANATIAEQMGTIDAHKRVVDNASISLSVRREELKKLIELNPAFRSALQGEAIDLVALQEAYDKVSNAIRLKAQAEAASALSAEKYKDVLEITTLSKRIEIAYGQQGGKKIGISSEELTDSEVDLVKTLRTVDFNRNLGEGGYATFERANFQKVMSELKKRESQAMDVYNAYLNIQADARKNLTEAENVISEEQAKAAAEAAKGFEVDIANLKRQIEALDKQIENFQGTRVKLTQLVTQRKKLQEELDALLDKTKSKGSGYRGSRIGGEDKDELRDIDAKRDKELADEKRFRLENLVTEEQHVKNIRDIQIRAIDAKLTLIKGSNAAERKLIADLMLERITIQQDTEDKIYNIKKAAAERDLQDSLRTADDERRAVVENPASRPLQKLQAERQYQETALVSQLAFNDRMATLEKERGDRSVEEERKRAEAIRAIMFALARIRMETEKETLEQALRDVEDSATKQINEVKQRVAAQTIAILEDKNTGDATKAAQINNLQRDETKSILANEVAENKLALIEKEKQYKAGLITEAAYSDAKTRLKLAELALAKHVADTEQSYMQRTLNMFKDAYRNITGIFKGVQATREQIDASVKAASNSVNQAVSVAFEGYFRGKEAQIDREKDVALQRLSIEEKQILATAESESEKESIRNQFEYKRKQQEKQAAEERKKIALTQMSIEFGLAVAKTLASYPFPWSLIPVAGLTALYLANRAQAQNTQFAKGGMLTKLFGKGGALIKKYAFGGMPSAGGEIQGPSHAQGGVPFNANSEAEGKELYIINKRSSGLNKRITVTGTPRQVASAVNSFGGGVNFAPGGNLQKLEYGGMLGSNLRAPVNPQAYLNPNSGSGAVDDVYKAIAQQTENINTLAKQTNERIDKLQVQVVATEVVATDNKVKKAKSIGTV